MGVGEYLRQMRASAAIRLLRTTALPLPLVAERVGLPSAAQLTRLLKSHTGKTAKEIRQGSGE
jgi:transcriptional regulator GlxA family with amidase domain